MSENKYFASKPAIDLANILDGRTTDWTNSILSNGFLDKLKRCYAAYHGATFADAGETHTISFSGEQGELVNLPVNQWRNIASHILVMTISNRPSINCRATNTDYKSLVQTHLANNVLEYYLREKKLEQYIKQAVEYAIVYGSGFIIMEWDALRGEMIDYIEETKTKIYEGDIVFENLSPFDVMYDGTKETGNHDWVLIRRWKNKWDLAAKYPDWAKKIIELPTKSDLQTFKLGMNDTTDDVAVYEFYHNRTAAMPDGRFLMYLSADIVPQDVAMPYRMLPVYRIAPANIHGTPHGYTPMFDLLPLQEALNSLYSTILTNQAAFGVQNILCPRGIDINVAQLVGGLNIIDYNPTAGKPEPLSLCSTPAEVFKFLEMIEHTMETLSGVNSVARGNPEASLKSGTALALVQSQALQFNSGLNQSYVELVESVGTGVIKMLQDFANTPRMVAIAGKSQRSYMKEFSSDDLSNIARVVVDIGNPMSTSTAGRIQIAQELIQYGTITPQQYMNVLHSGNLDELTEDVVKENLLMRAENETIMEGQSVVAAFTDDHREHIDYHRRLLFDPDLRKDANLIELVQSHIQEHINLLRTVDPDLLVILKQQPLQPQGGPPQGGAPPPGAPQPGEAPPPPGADTMAANQQTGPEMVNGGKQLGGPGLEAPVNIAQPAKVDGNMLANPALQQNLLGNVK